MFKSIKMSALALGLAVAANVVACGNGTDGIVPENDLYIPVGAKSVSNITEESFNSVVEKISALYAPIIASKGGQLKVVKHWEDGKVNAYALQSGSVWEVHMFGGLARHQAVTEDGFALVMCHEIGHHIGGAPKKTIGGGGGMWGGSSSKEPTTMWATNEGGADYFATVKCLRNVFMNDNNAEIVSKLNAPETLTTACEKSYKSAVDINICIRGGMAGQSLANMFAATAQDGKGAQFNTPDKSVVKKMFHNHPKAQCRLDTYFQGAICDAALNDDVSDTDANKGVCTIANGHTVGNRPLCWYLPEEAN